MAASASASAGSCNLQQSPVMSLSSKLRVSSNLSFSGNRGIPPKQNPSLSSSGNQGIPPNQHSKLSSSVKKSGGGAKLGESAAAGSYASALADVATANGTLELTAEDIDKIDTIFSEDEVFDFFINPTIPLETKRKVIDEISTTSKLQTHTANLLNILIDMKRINLIHTVVQEFEYVYNNLTDTTPAVVTSVVKLESQHLAQIAKGVQRLTGAKNVRIKTVIDPSLVAGFTIKYGNSGSKMVDFSVKKQLEDIAAQLNIGDVQLAV